MVPFLHQCWQVLAELAPWLILGLLVAGALHVWLPPGFIRRHLGGGGPASTIKAVFLGVPMPLCSCGVIPAAIGLKKDGASDGASVGFLISTPQTGVDSIAVSAAFLGLPFAIFKVASAFITGIVGGLLTDSLVKPAPAAPAPVAADAAPRSHRAKLRELLVFAFDDLLYMIWRWIVVGVLVSAAIATWLDPGVFTQYGWTQGLGGLLLVLAISLPLYVCATSSVPVAAALVHAGLPAGAALVFLMAGPATNMATVGAIYRAFGKKVLGIYLAVIVLGSLLSAWLFESVLGTMVHDHPLAHEHQPWWTVPAVVALLLLIGRYAWRDLRSWMARRGSTAPAAETESFMVQGMTCKGCVQRVDEALRSQPGVGSVTIDLESGQTTVRGQALRPVDLHGAVRDLGFGVEP